MRYVALRVIAFATFIFLALTPALAQRDMGTLLGTVSDATGAVIPGATITITDDGAVVIETSGGNKVTVDGEKILMEAPSIQSSANGGKTEVSASGFDAQDGALKVS